MTETPTLPLPVFHVDDARHVAYWRRQLRNPPPRLELPFDRQPPATATLANARCTASVEPALANAVSALARAERASTLMLAIAATAAWASRLSGHEDVIVASPLSQAGAAGGNRGGSLIAPMRINCGSSLSFVDLIRRSREAVLDALANRNLSNAAMAEEMHAWSAGVQISLSMSAAGNEKGPTSIPADLHLWLSDDLSQAELWYASDRFESATAKRFLDQLLLVLTAASTNATAQISSLPMVTQGDLEIHRGLAGVKLAIPPESPAEIFQQIAAAKPDAPAVCAGTVTLTYADLDRQANQLANRLKRNGAGPDGVVAVCVGRDTTLPLAFIAALKSGAAYLPLDPRHPADRLRAIVADAGASQVVTSEALASAFSGTELNIVCLDRDADAIAAEATDSPQQHSSPADIAYVIYTSGSTGKPKGVEITNHGLANLAASLRDQFHVGSNDRVSLFSSAAFDASVWEMSMALFSGAMLGVLTTAEATPNEIAAEAAKLGLTVGTYPPTLLHALSPESLGSPRLVISAGEACDAQLVNNWGYGRRFVNAYGPTEVTVCATFADCTAPATAPPPIGRPMPNAVAYVLDPNLEPVAVGAIGEIFVAGAGLARGYRHRPSLTAEAYLPDPFGLPGSRMYRTGDFGRLGNDGQLYYRGRSDSQVKLRGFRIELGEIEQKIKAHPGVREAAVMVHQVNGDGRLAAYFTPADQSTSDDPRAVTDSLRAQLNMVLPDYMVPAYFTVLENMPLTTSGKIDRAKLLRPGRDAGAQGTTGEWAPLEQRIAAIWAQTLGLKQVARLDSFFEIGGHSLVAAQMIEQVRLDLDMTRLPMRMLFEQPVLAEFAAAIERLRTT